MSIEDNKALARRWFEDVINQRSLDGIDQIYSPSYVHHGPRGQEMRGIESLRQFAESLHAAFAERHAAVEQQIAVDDIVVSRFTTRGVNTGPLRGNPPTGRDTTIEGILISRIEKGRIAEEWEIADLYGFFGDLGIIEMPQ